MNHKVIIGIAVVVLVLFLIPMLPQIRANFQGPDHEQDAATQARIQQAVQAYRMRTGGHNPPTLQALVPNYLDHVPTTSKNMEFIYDPGSGRVRNPHPPEDVAGEQQPAHGPGRARAGTSGGLMGETMTGIGIQQELR